MRINSVGSVVPPEKKYVRNSQAIQEGRSVSGGYDSLQISPETLAINSIISAAKSAGEIDYAKVDALRQQVSRETYAPNTNAIVNGILNFK